MNANLTHGCNLRDALRFARLLGCSIHRPRRTGEVVLSHPALPNTCLRVCGHRKDTSRCLTHWLRRLLDHLAR